MRFSYYSDRRFKPSSLAHELCSKIEVTPASRPVCPFAHCLLPLRLGCSASKCFCLLLFQRYIFSLPIERSFARPLCSLARSGNAPTGPPLRYLLVGNSRIIINAYAVAGIGGREVTFLCSPQTSLSLLLPLIHCRRAFPLSTKIQKTSKNNSIDIAHYLPTDIDSSILPDIKISSLFLLPFSLLSLKIFIILPFIFMKSSPLPSDIQPAFKCSLTKVMYCTNREKSIEIK